VQKSKNEKIELLHLIQQSNSKRNTSNERQNKSPRQLNSMSRNVNSIMQANKDYLMELQRKEEEEELAKTAHLRRAEEDAQKQAALARAKGIVCLFVTE
jgi:hypothetical protein